eukprot:TRINITY_DN1283_c0_g1_i2.p1 TRINITY_DN1283_c0_g1~~TRINITY_DN1283_c0_g1_i2.p1  ORF type:complete len:281 (-),score=40.04 TRINITY_DN1283_c0_g1_i2:108-950(-)
MDLSFIPENFVLPSMEELFDSNDAVSAAFQEENLAEGSLSIENLFTPAFEEQRQQFVFAPVSIISETASTPFVSLTSPETFSCEPSPSDVLSAEELEFSFQPEEAFSKKKIKLDNGVATLLPSRVHLPRKILLEISSEEYETHIKNIRQSRQLTEEEELVHKEQRRLVRNREAASFSRAKKKSQVEHLSDEVNKLEDERKNLEKQVDRLTVENLWIANEMQFISRLVEHSPALTTAFRLLRSKVDLGEAEPGFKETLSRKRSRPFNDSVKELKVVSSTAA